MVDFDFSSDDVAETEAFLSDAYTPMHLGRVGEHAHARLVRRSTVGVSIDEVSVDFDMAYEADALDRLCICSIHEGTITARGPGGTTRDYGPGQTVLLTPPDRPYSGVARHADYTVTLLDPRLLDGVDGAEVHLTSDRPVSREAAQRLDDTIVWMRDSVLGSPASSHVMRTCATRALAAAVLDAFPHDEREESSGSPMPGTVRRAIDLIESDAAADLGVDDLATAARVTPRALQYAFRRHLDTTPLEYLRRVRLAHAREDLLDPDESTSVADVATRWGFFHLGRFSAAYREEYDESPRQTLGRTRSA